MSARHDRICFFPEPRGKAIAHSSYGLLGFDDMDMGYDGRGFFVYLFVKRVNECRSADGPWHRRVENAESDSVEETGQLHEVKVRAVCER
jgi:hypothetical protein